VHRPGGLGGRLRGDSAVVPSGKQPISWSRHAKLANTPALMTCSPAKQPISQGLEVSTPHPQRLQYCWFSSWSMPISGRTSQRVRVLTTDPVLVPARPAAIGPAGWRRPRQNFTAQGW